MHILITGAAGFIGQLVAEQLLNDPQHTVLLTDVVDPPIPKNVKYPQNAQTATVDLCTSASTVVPSTLSAAYIFHGIMSAGSETNFDLGLRVNIDSTHSLLDAIRTHAPGIRVIYSSSQAVYGPPFPSNPTTSSFGPVNESTRPTPQSSYGTAKLICEALINDYTRRGFIDGLSCRYPTITVRPGRPTAAASSFLSGMIREPLNGKPSVVPLEDRAFTSWVCSPRTLLHNLLHALTVSTAGVLLPHDRAVNFPGIAVTVQQMRDALEKVGGPEALALVREERDEGLEKILRSWAPEIEDGRAAELGFERDGSFERAVWDYKERVDRGEG